METQTAEQRLLQNIADADFRDYQREERAKRIRNAQRWILTLAAIVWIAWAVAWWCK